MLCFSFLATGQRASRGVGDGEGVVQHEQLVVELLHTVHARRVGRRQQPCAGRGLLGLGLGLLVARVVQQILLRHECRRRRREARTRDGGGNVVVVVVPVPVAVSTGIVVVVIPQGVLSLLALPLRPPPALALVAARALE